MIVPDNYMDSLNPHNNECSSSTEELTERDSLINRDMMYFCKRGWGCGCMPHESKDINRIQKFVLCNSYIVFCYGIDMGHEFYDLVTERWLY
jgi:hypothetical protein